MQNFNPASQLMKKIGKKEKKIINLFFSLKSTMHKKIIWMIDHSTGILTINHAKINVFLTSILRVYCVLTA